MDNRVEQGLLDVDTYSGTKFLYNVKLLCQGTLHRGGNGEWRQADKSRWFGENLIHKPGGIS
jgi:hypothetical protein